MQFSPFSCFFLFLRSKYSPRHPVFKHAQSIFFSWYDRSVSHLHRAKDKIIILKSFHRTTLHFTFFCLLIFLLQIRYPRLPRLKTFLDRTAALTIARGHTKKRIVFTFARGSNQQIQHASALWPWGSAQPLTEMSTRNLPARKVDDITAVCEPIFWKM
jgi:hypothetical protein